MNGGNRCSNGAHFAAKELSYLSQEPGNDRKQYRKPDQRDAGEDNILRHHHEKQPDDGQEVATHGGCNQIERGARRLGIVSDAGDQIGRLVFLEKRHILRQNRIKNFALGGGYNRIADPGQNNFLAIRGETLDDIDRCNAPADQHHHGGITVDKHFIDEIAHDPGAKPGCACNHRHKQDRQRVARQKGTNIFRNKAL